MQNKHHHLGCAGRVRPIKSMHEKEEIFQDKQISML